MSDTPARTAAPRTPSPAHSPDPRAAATDTPPPSATRHSVASASTSPAFPGAAAAAQPPASPVASAAAAAASAADASPASPDSGSLRVMEGKYPRAIKSMVIAPNDSLIAMLDYKGTIRIWDVQTTKLVVVLRTGRRAASDSDSDSDSESDSESESESESSMAMSLVENICFSPDSTLLVASTKRHSVCVLEATTGRICLDIQTICTFANVACACVPINGQNVPAMITGDCSSVVLLDLSSGASLQTLEVADRTDYGFYVYVVAVSADGRSVASFASGETTQLWNLDTGVSRHVGTPMPIEYFPVLRFSPDGQLLAIGSRKHVQICSVETGELVRRFRDDGSTIAFSPCGQLWFNQKLVNVQGDFEQIRYECPPSSHRVYDFSSNGHMVLESTSSIALYDPELASKEAEERRAREEEERTRAEEARLQEVAAEEARSQARMREHLDQVYRHGVELGVLAERQRQSEAVRPSLLATIERAANTPDRPRYACVICLGDEPRMTCVPCGHGIGVGCMLRLVQEGSPVTCPICRAAVETAVQTVETVDDHRECSAAKRARTE